jgi:hypothetical protein
MLQPAMVGTPAVPLGAPPAVPAPPVAVTPPDETPLAPPWAAASSAPLPGVAFEQPSRTKNTTEQTACFIAPFLRGHILATRLGEVAKHFR